MCRLRFQVRQSTNSVDEMQRKFALAIVIALTLTVGGAGAYFGYSGWLESRIRYLHQECRRTQDAKRWSDMELAARQWTRLQPSEADCWLYLAIALEEQGDLEASEKALQSLPDRKSKSVQGLLELSNLQFGPLNKPLAGVATCERILSLRPQILEAHRRLIFFDALCVQRAQMTSRIYRSIELGCEPREVYVYLMLGEAPIFTNGFETVNHWLQRDPSSELFLVARTVQMAENLALLKNPTSQSQAQLEQAERLLTGYRQQFPANRVVLWFFLKNAARRSDVESVGKLLASVPDDAGDEGVFWRYRGWFHSQRDEFADAELAYRKAVELTPLDFQIWHEWADVLRKKGELPEAAKLQAVAAEGRQLRLSLQQLKDASTITDTQLNQIRIYAHKCGDNRVAQALARRLRVPAAP